jgi:hypothetical protein
MLSFEAVSSHSHLFSLFQKHSDRIVPSLPVCWSPRLFSDAHFTWWHVATLWCVLYITLVSGLVMSVKRVSVWDWLLLQGLTLLWQHMRVSQKVSFPVLGHPWDHSILCHVMWWWLQLPVTQCYSALRNQCDIAARLAYPVCAIAAQ